MRISDWSSDVCSSDLGASALGCECPPVSAFGRHLLLYFAPEGTHPHLPTCAAVEGRKTEIRLSKNPPFRHACAPAYRRGRQDRKSVGYGRSVSVRVDLGGRRTIQKKRKQEKIA